MADEYELVIGKWGKPKIGYGSTNQPLVVKKYDVIGGKTGYTRPAGYCFVTAARFEQREVVMAFLGAPEKLTRFGDFNRVAAWLDRGAPGAKVSTKRPKRATPRLDVEARGRVAAP